MRIIEDVKLDFSDVLLLPKRSSLTSRNEVNLERVFKFKHSNNILSAIGIIAANMDGTGTFSMAKKLAEQKMLTSLHKHHDVDELVQFFTANEAILPYIFYSIGANERDVNKMKLTYSKLGSTPTNITIDVANGYAESFIRFVSEIRDLYPDAVIMAGNCVTPELAEQLILSGADIVKTGIGSGGQCTTRIVAGVGYPQLSAVIETSDAVHGLGGHLCSDGGCVVPGDVAKAFGAGADFVMLGSMLSGHDESEGDIEGVTIRYVGTSVNKAVNSQQANYTYLVKNSTSGILVPVSEADIDNLSRCTKTSDSLYQKYKQLFEITIPADPKMVFYGMSSKTAQDKHNGGVADYRASEGRTTLVPYKGPVQNTMQQILGGIRSACTYCGARTLKELPKRATFVKINRTHNTAFENNTISY